MDAGRYIVLVLILAFVSKSVSRPIIRLLPKLQRPDIDDCESWKYNVETNNAGEWSTSPERCVNYLQGYMTGDQYWLDSEMVVDYAVEYLKTVKLTGKDAWVFGVDDTLLSTVPYYEHHRFGADAFDEDSYNDWVALANAPAVPASWRLYYEVAEKGFTIIFLTGRDEFQRDVTKKNLIKAGFDYWDKLILRGTSDQGKPAITYKSEKRKELEDEGYTIHGSYGDQWSDLLGFSTAKRSFKVPNPMYHVA